MVVTNDNLPLTLDCLGVTIQSYSLSFIQDGEIPSCRDHLKDVYLSLESRELNLSGKAMVLKFHLNDRTSKL